MQFLSHYTVHLKLIQHYMLAALELKFFFKKKEEVTFALYMTHCLQGLKNLWFNLSLFNFGTMCLLE